MDTNVSQEDRDLAVSFCRKHLDGIWESVSSEQVDVSRVSGGMTNILYRCALNGNIKALTNEPEQVLLRIYGRSQGDINVQLEVFNQLADANLGPKLYCSFEGGRFEEFLPSSPVTWEEMTSDSISRVIARKIAAFHKLNVQSLPKEPNWLINKIHHYHNFIESLKNEPIQFNDDVDVSTKQIGVKLVQTNFKPEIEYLAKVLKDSRSPLVFSNNDLHQNNILLKHDSECDLEDRIVLIDFEYGSYNYRGFDIGNHLNEWCFDYTGDEYPNFNASPDRFPSEERQREFLSHYISRMDDDFLGSGLSKQDKIEILFEELQPFFMASNLLWGIWAIKSARVSKIKFGYWEMAKQKWEIYLMCKKKFEDKQTLSNTKHNVINLQSSKM